jgi:hypothetical protein
VFGTLPAPPLVLADERTVFTPLIVP